MSAYSPSGSSNPMIDTNKRVDNEMDEKIGSYSKLLDIVSESERINLRTKLLSAKLMKEKLVAMTALAKAQTILAEMDVLVAENNLKTAFEQLDKFKEEHSDAEKKTSSQKPEIKHNTLKEQEKFALKDTSNQHRVASPETNKESAKNATTEKQKTQIRKSRSEIPSTERKKRSHSNSSSSKKHKKKSKKSHHKKTVDCQSTLTETTISPIAKSKSNPYNTKAVQTCTEWYQSKQSDIESLKLTHRVTEDDDTVLIADLSEGPRTHRNAVNLSKALQQVLAPKAVVRNCRPDDLTQSPGEYKKQLLFEDEPKKEAKPSKVKVKSEAPDNDTLNNSTDNLVNGLFKDIMEAKSKEAASKANSTNLTSNTGAICKHMLRQLLEKC